MFGGDLAGSVDELPRRICEHRPKLMTGGRRKKVFDRFWLMSFGARGRPAPP
jgi:hypothetical protein